MTIKPNSLSLGRAFTRARFADRALARVRSSGTGMEPWHLGGNNTWQCYALELPKKIQIRRLRFRQYYSLECSQNLPIWHRGGIRWQHYAFRFPNVSQPCISKAHPANIMALRFPTVPHADIPEAYSGRIMASRFLRVSESLPSKQDLAMLWP